MRKQRQRLEHVRDVPLLRWKVDSARGNLHVDIKHKGKSTRAGKPLADLRGQHGRFHFDAHGVHTRRFTAYTSPKTPNEIASNTSAMRFASPYSSDCT